jgi:hypothetical protein
MKRTLLTALSISLLTGCADVQTHTTTKYTAAVVSPSLEPSMRSLRNLEVVDGDAVYESGMEGRFYKLSCKFLQRGTESEFFRLLHDPNPVVRVMGIWCLNKTDSVKHKNTIEDMYQDSEEVSFAPVGCIVETTPVGEIARQVVRNPYLLEWRHHSEEKKTHNKS